MKLYDNHGAINTPPPPRAPPSILQGLHLPESPPNIDTFSRHLREMMQIYTEHRGGTGSKLGRIRLSPAMDNSTNGLVSNRLELGVVRLPKGD